MSRPRMGATVRACGDRIFLAVSWGDGEAIHLDRTGCGRTAAEDIEELPLEGLEDIGPYVVDRMALDVQQARTIGHYLEGRGWTWHDVGQLPTGVAEYMGRRVWRMAVEVTIELEVEALTEDEAMELASDRVSDELGALELSEYTIDRVDCADY